MRSALRWLLTGVALTGLTGCALMAGWADRTGQHRSASRARSDYNVCAAESGTGTVDPHANYDQTEIARQRLLACMYGRGWRATSLQHL
jgi:hypothetical protein